MVVTKEPAWFVKITDFGISKRRQEDVTAFYTSQQGTVTFAAPEAFGVSPAGKVDSYTFSVDMWSLGAVSYRMLAGMTAFASILDLLQFVTGMMQFPLEALETQGPTEDAVDFILKLMVAKPGDRLSASGARDHPWMRVASPTTRPSESVE
jgi:calcium/calmodulin-dependent protein kinase I